MGADGTGVLAPLFAAGTALGLGDADLLDRFLGGDSAAFELIVRRHGPMVLSVGRRVLDDPHDADDVFQATFALLATRAGSIRRRASLAAWLHGAARRLAVTARVGDRRRRARERVWASTTTQPGAGAWGGDDDWRSVLDAELTRLPERLRAPLILCDLEGSTHEAAAATLGCPVGTVKSRLHRGRSRLRSRLGRLGLDPTVPSALLAAPLGGPLLSEAIVHQAVRGATTAAAGSVRLQDLDLFRGRLRLMPLGSSLRTVGLGLLGVGLLGAGAWAWRPTPEPPDAGSAAVAPALGATTPGSRPPLVPERAPVEKNRLPNGLTVILRPVAGAKDTALVVTYDIGSDHDPAGQSGLAHLAEHLYLTAAAGPTPTRTTDELQARYPQGTNAQTGDRYTVVSTVFAAADLDRELADAAARMSALHIEATDLDRERPRLLAEIDTMFAGFPLLAAPNNARELVRPTPHAGRRGGLPDAVGRLTLGVIQQRLDRHYRPRNATLSIAGQLDPTTVRATIASRFGPIAPGEPIPPASDPGPPAVGTVRAVVTTGGNPGDSPLVAVSYLAPRPDDPLYAPFLILASRLWGTSAELATDQMAGFGFLVGFTPLDDGAALTLTSGVKPGETTADATRRIEALVARTVAPALGFFEAGQVASALGMLFGTTKVPDQALASNLYGVAFALARREQLGIEPKRCGAAIRGATTATLQQAAERFLAPGRHAVAVIQR